VPFLESKRPFYCLHDLDRAVLRLAYTVGRLGQRLCLARPTTEIAVAGTPSLTRGFLRVLAWRRDSAIFLAIGPDLSVWPTAATPRCRHADANWCSVVIAWADSSEWPTSWDAYCAVSDRSTHLACPSSRFCNGGQVGRTSLRSRPYDKSRRRLRLRSGGFLGVNIRCRTINIVAGLPHSG